MKEQKHAFALPSFSRAPLQLISMRKLHYTSAPTNLQVLLRMASTRTRGGLSKGFTLIELLIVVAIVGILAAAALPQYLRARDAAEAGAIVGEAVGLSKECAVVAASDIQTGITAVSRGVALNRSGMQNNCDAAGAGGTIVGTMPTGRSMPAGIRCLDQESADGNTTVTLTVAGAGATTCAFGGGGGGAPPT